MNQSYREFFERLWERFLRRRKTLLLPQSYILDQPTVSDADYETIFGREDLAGEPRAWENYFPVEEFQGSTGDCVSHSRTNIWETLYRYLNPGREINLSELYLAVGSGTSLRGNGLKNVSEFFRSKGVPLDKLCDYDQDMLDDPAGTWAKRKAKFDAVPPDAKRYFGGSYSFLPTHLPALKAALAYTPVQIAVPLGETYRQGGIIQPPRQISSYHAETVYKISDAIYVLDSIGPPLKRFSLNYPLIAAMSFRDLPDDWKKFNTGGTSLLVRLTGKYILRAEANGELYHVLPDRLVKITISISYPAMKEEFNRYLRIHERFLGISETDFNSLLTALRDVGGIIDE